MAATQNTKAFYNTEIPTDWEVKELGELFEFKNGINAGKESYGKGVKFINIMEVIYHDYIFPEMIPGTVQISDEQKELYLVKDGDVLFNRTSETVEEIGLSAVFNGNEEVVFGGFVIRGRPIVSEIDNLFKRYCLRSTIVRNQIIKGGQGAVRTNIGQGDLSQIKIPLPPLPEQKAIAQVLSTADAAIHTTEKLIAQKELRKKWLMQQLLSEKRIVKNEKWCKSGVKRVKFGEIALIKKGKPITEKEIHEGNFQIIAGGKSSPYSHNQYTDENVITISASGAYAGYVAFHPYKIWASDCSVIDELKGKSVIAYLYYQLIFHQEKIYKLQTGGAQPHVFPKDIFHFPLFIVHSLEEQTAIAQVLQAADKEISLLKAKAEKLKEQKKGLMQVLLTGRKRLNLDSLDLGIKGLKATKSNDQVIL